MSPDTLLYETEAGAVVPGFTQAELRAIVEAASTIQERLGPRFEPVEDSTPDEKRLIRWCQAVAKGDWELFRKRLRWDGLEMEQARDAVRPARLRSSSALPAWTTTLNRCLAEIETASSGLQERFCDEGEPIPYEHLLAPIICEARRMVQRDFDDMTIPVTGDALGNLERLLLIQLSALSAQALQVDFSVFKATSYPGSASHDIADAAYQAFIARMRAGEIRSFFLQFSVLARKIAVRVDHWAANTVRFLRRLHTDWAAIRHTFSDQDPGRVCRIESGVSDPHCGGQQAHIVHCESGLRFVYKPKHMGLGMAFQRLLAWCNDHGMTPSLRPLRMIGGPGYGWVEYISTEACRSPAEATRYFQRAGGLLALAYLLNGKDLHHENIVAQGDQPMLIDLETLMVPSVMDPSATNENGHVVPGEKGVDLEDSVLGTMLLPRWFVDESRSGDVIVRNLAGLAGEIYQTAARSIHWTHINTDRMHIATIRRDNAFGNNVPRLDGKTLRSSDYVEEIQEGFERAYRIVREHMDDLVREGGVLSGFAGQPVRFVFRATSIYGKLRRGLRNPRFLRDGLDASIALEALVQGCLPFPTPPPIWPIIRSEQRDVQDDDVPLFKTYTTSTSVFDATGRELGLMFSASGLEAVRSRLRALDDEDLGFQKDLIWASFYTQQVGSAHDGLPARASGTHPAEKVPSLTDALVRDEAHRILERLRRTTVRGEQDSLSWITMANMDPRVKRYQIRRIGHDLFYGRCGIGLFLAACSHVGESSAMVGDMIRGTLRPLIDRLGDETKREEIARVPIIGGTYGLGSYVYALTQIGALLDDDGAIDGARVAASLISEVIEKDQHFDVVFGAAGAALGLLTLYRATGDEGILAKADRCGKHLLRNREVEPESGCRVWRTLPSRFMTGFSHGAAGIAHALAELYRATGSRAYLEAALEAFAFERSLFLPEVANWVPSRSYLEKPETYDALWSTWCRGATGIGLARLANLDLFSEAERKDVEIAIETTQTHLLRGVDHPCCGVMGRVAFLMTAAETLQRPDLAHAARRAAGHVVARARENNTYTLTLDGQDKLRPGFFQGLSGIGYQLLRLVNREMLPSVLLLR